MGSILFGGVMFEVEDVVVADRKDYQKEKTEDIPIDMHQEKVE